MCTVTYYDCEETYFPTQAAKPRELQQAYGSFRAVDWTMGGRKIKADIEHVLGIPEENEKGWFTATTPHPASE